MRTQKEKQEKKKEKKNGPEDGTDNRLMKQEPDGCDVIRIVIKAYMQLAILNGKK